MHNIPKVILQIASVVKTLEYTVEQYVNAVLMIYPNLVCQYPKQVNEERVKTTRQYITE